MINNIITYYQLNISLSHPFKIIKNITSYDQSSHNALTNKQFSNKPLFVPLINFFSNLVRMQYFK